MMREEALGSIKILGPEIRQNKILMDYLSYTLKWLELLFRWGHVLFAIL